MAEKTMRKHMNERFGEVFNYSEKPPLPRSLNIELNSNCNQTCVFCPFHGKYAPSKVISSSIKCKTVKDILDQAKELGIGEKEVGFYLAGEVFLYKNLAEVIEYAKKIGFEYTFITTNGALANKEKMKAVLNAGLDSIRFSVNAADRNSYREIHGKDNFEDVVNNIRFMHKYIIKNNLHVATSLSCVITKRTLGIQEKVKELFNDLVDDIIFIPVMLNRLKCDKKFIREYELIDESNSEINKEFVCPMLFDTMYINASLKVVPCCDAYDDNCFFYDLEKDFNLKNAWDCDLYKRYRNIFLNRENDKGTICEKCMLRMKGIDRLYFENGQ